MGASDKTISAYESAKPVLERKTRRSLQATACIAVLRLVY
jgi:hypothetical protein